MTSRQELESLADLQQGLTPQERGRKFEGWLNKVLTQENLKPRTSFRPKGEEIDGSFLYEGRHYLLEAKWWNDTVPASAIYQFKGKVDGKLVGTVGVFISMSNYSPNAVDALRVGKELNVVLFDRDDVFAAAMHGFSKVLEHKIRQAVEKGEVFVPYAATISPERKSETAATGNSITVVAEGARDTLLVRAIFDNLLTSGTPTRHLTVLTSQGVMGLANIARAASESHAGGVLIFSDFEGDPEDLPRDLLLVKDRTQGVLIGPWSRKWLGLSSGVKAKNLRPHDLYARAAEIDIEDLSKRDGNFARLIRALST